MYLYTLLLLLLLLVVVVVVVVVSLGQARRQAAGGVLRARGGAPGRRSPALQLSSSLTLFSSL